MLREIGHDFYIGDSVVFIGVERKTSVYIYLDLDLDFIVYGSVIINNMKQYYTIDIRHTERNYINIPKFTFLFIGFCIRFEFNNN